jgi:Cu-Zn family superoxide dismutase
MRLLPSIALAIICAWVPLPGAAQQQVNPLPAAVADIKDANGRTVATAELREDQGKVQVALAVSSQTSLTGKHAVHITELGRCDPPDFSTAGGIFNPFAKKHGLLSNGGPMVGDLPNLNMPIQRYNAPALGASLSGGPGSLLGGQGTALIIHEGADDSLTDPDGNAGARIACGVITAVGQSSGGIGQASAVPQTSGAGPTIGPALLIAMLGVALVAAGLLLRRAPRTR